MGHAAVHRIGILPGQLVSGSRLRSCHERFSDGSLYTQVQHVMPGVLRAPVPVLAIVLPATPVPAWSLGCVFAPRICILLGHLVSGSRLCSSYGHFSLYAQVPHVIPLAVRALLAAPARVSPATPVPT
jgi:hypothetical protein